MEYYSELQWLIATFTVFENVFKQTRWKLRSTDLKSDILGQKRSPVTPSWSADGFCPDLPLNQVTTLCACNPFHPSVLLRLSLTTPFSWHWIPLDDLNSNKVLLRLEIRHLASVHASWSSFSRVELTFIALGFSTAVIISC